MSSTVIITAMVMMKSRINNCIFTIWVVLTVINRSDQECLCNVRFVGEYCGTELNERNGNNECGRHMYFCGKNNLQKEAVLLKSCTRPGYECDVKLNGGIIAIKKTKNNFIK